MGLGIWWNCQSSNILLMSFVERQIDKQMIPNITTFYFSGSSYICVIHSLPSVTSKLIWFIEVKILELLDFSELLTIIHKIVLYKVLDRNWLFHILLGYFWASSVAQLVKNLPDDVGDMRHRPDPWVGKIPWRRK